MKRVWTFLLAILSVINSISATGRQAAESVSGQNASSEVRQATAGLCASASAKSLDDEAAPAKKSSAFSYRGFIGGMMLHTGYVRSGNLSVSSLSGTVHDVPVSGAPFGVGGAIRFMFGPHLRLGVEGYVSNLNYGKYHSRASTGWGGFLADCAWSVGEKSKLFIGATIGGGSQTNTTILSPVEDDYLAEECISYRKYAFCAVAPFFGYELAVNQKLNMVFKADWLLNASRRRDDFLSGPRIYVGFMFGHAGE